MDEFSPDRAAWKRLRTTAVTFLGAEWTALAAQNRINELTGDGECVPTDTAGVARHMRAAVIAGTLSLTTAGVGFEGLMLTGVDSLPGPVSGALRATVAGVSTTIAAAGVYLAADAHLAARKIVNDSEKSANSALQVGKLPKFDQIGRQPLDVAQQIKTFGQEASQRNSGPFVEAYYGLNLPVLSPTTPRAGIEAAAFELALTADTYFGRTLASKAPHLLD